VSIRLLTFFSIGVFAARQASNIPNVPSAFPAYDASGDGIMGMSANESARPGLSHPGRLQNMDPPESGEFTVTPRRAGPAAVSADQLRHPLTGKSLRTIQKAEKLIAAHDYVHAREELQKAVKDQAAAPYAHSLLGQEYERDGRFGEAAVELEQAVRLLPSSVPDRANLGYALLMTGQFSAAEKELQRALELQPANPRTHLVLGMLYYTLKTRDREAQEHLEFAARELPGAHLMLAKFYRLTGRTDAADREFQMFLEAAGSPNSVATAARQWLDHGGTPASLR
jgi:Flp pilus assembly protein TadD